MREAVRERRGAPYVLSTFRRFHAVQAAEALATAGRDVVLLLPDVSARPPAGAKLVRGPVIPRALEILARLARSGAVDALAVSAADAASARWLDRHDASVLHGFSLFSLETLRAARKRGIPCAVERSGAHIRTQRRLVAEERARLDLPAESGDYYSSERALERMLEEYELADRIVVSSEFVRRTFVAEGVPASKLAVVPLGANFEARSWRARPTSPLTVVSIGNGLEAKGMIDVLEAWRLADLPGELKIRSPILPSWAPLLSARGASRTMVLPPMSHAAVLTLLSSASVFCLLSIQDGFGMVVLEAMACGCPVIVSRNVGASDVVRDGENGFVVEIRDPAQAAARLAQLASDPELLQRMSRQALATARDHGWSRYAGRLLEMWSGVEDRRVARS